MARNPSRKEIVIRIDQELSDKIDAMKNEMCALSRNETIRRCLHNEFNRLFDYKFAMKTRALGTKEHKKSKDEIDLENGERICEMLGGVVSNEGGSLSCKYDVYEAVGNRVDSYGTQLPLRFLTEDIVARQYSPSKDVVEKILAKN